MGRVELLKLNNLTGLLHLLVCVFVFRMFTPSLTAHSWLYN